MFFDEVGWDKPKYLRMNFGFSVFRAFKTFRFLRVLNYVGAEKENTVVLLSVFENVFDAFRLLRVLNYEGAGSR